MMLFHPYHPGAPLVHSAAHGSAMYMPGLGTSRPVYNGGKEESMMGLQGPGQQQQQQPQPQLFGGQALNMAAPIHQPNSQKRSRSPSPPPQLYHSYKPPMLSPYNPSKQYYSYEIDDWMIFLFVFFRKHWQSLRRKSCRSRKYFLHSLGVGECGQRCRLPVTCTRIHVQLRVISSIVLSTSGRIQRRVTFAQTSGVRRSAGLHHDTKSPKKYLQNIHSFCLFLFY